MDEQQIMDAVEDARWYAMVEVLNGCTEAELVAVLGYSDSDEVKEAVDKILVDRKAAATHAEP